MRTRYRQLILIIILILVGTTAISSKAPKVRAQEPYEEFYKSLHELSQALQKLPQYE